MFKNVVALFTLFLPLILAVPLTPRDTPVAGNYIITLKDEVTIVDTNAHLVWASGLQRRSLQRRQVTTGEQPTSDEMKTYNMSTYTGYAGWFDEAALTQIQAKAAVKWVEPDLPIITSAITSQNGSEWGLERTSSRIETRGGAYTFDDSAGTGTFAYVVDSGINAQHVDFNGRVVLAANFAGGQHIDSVGHGTHVAGTIGSTTFGVAKNTTLMSVKVFGNQGNSGTSTIMQGFEFAVNDIMTNNRAGVSVINMSLGTERGIIQAFNSMIDAATMMGVLSVVASGNGVSNPQTGQFVSAIDTTQTTPGSAATAFVVGAIDSTNARGFFSNTGTKVDILAPGVDIKSTWIDNNTATNTISGTSMACPHVAGLAVYLKGLDSSLVLPADTAARIKSLATQGQITDVQDSPNLIAYNGIEFTAAAAAAASGTNLAGTGAMDLRVGTPMGTIRKTFRVSRRYTRSGVFERL